ncbi:hypothetical protein KUCAC02_023502, partial [Chaenocephalus aceratus]
DNGGSPESLSFSLALGRTKNNRRREGVSEDGDSVTIGSEPSVVVLSAEPNAQK